MILDGADKDGHKIGRLECRARGEFEQLS